MSAQGDRRAAGCTRGRPRDDQREGEGRDAGQIALFLLGACVIALTLIIGVVDVTAVQLARVRLYDVCDAAALDAADELAEATVYHQGLGAHVPVTDDGVRGRAATYLDGVGRPDHVTSWSLAPGTGTADGLSATVVVTGTVEPPIGASLLGAVSGPITVTVRSTASALVAR